MDFDPLRKGVISDAQFQRAIGAMNLPINQAQLAAISDQYRHGPGQVSYYRFTADMESSFLNEKESSPVKAAQQEFGMGRTNVHEDQRITEALNEVKRVMKTKNISIKPMFQDFDRTASGVVSNTQFNRVLLQAQLNLTPAVIDALMYRYSSGGRFDYYAMARDIDTFGLTVAPKQQNVIEFDERDRRSAIDPVAAPRIPANLERLLGRLRDDIKRNRVQLYEFIRDFDRLRIGIITQSQLANAMNMAHLYLTEDELELINSHFAADRNRVKYVDFLAEIADNVPIVDALPGQTQPSGQDDQGAMIIDEARRIMKTKNMSIKPAFQDFDRTKSGRVTLPQFVRVCLQFNLNVPDQILMNFARRYMDKPNSEEVNYVLFCLDIDKTQPIFTPDQQIAFDYDGELAKRKVDPGQNKYTTRKLPGVEVYRDVPEDVDDLIVKIRTHLARNRTRLHEFFRDFDKLRSGIITRTQLASGMNTARVPLSSTEISLLCSHFGVDHLRVNYRNILDLVEENSELKALIKDNAVLKSFGTMIKYGKQGMNHDEHLACQEVIRRFKAYVQKNYLDMKSHFQDWDWHNIGKISQKQFRQVLAQFKFNIADREFNCVCKQYDLDGAVNYVKFFEDTSIATIIKGREEGYKAPVHASNIDPQASNFNFSNPYCMNKTQESDVSALMAKIKAIIATKRVHARQFFQDYDPLRKGIIPKSKFRGALDNMKIELTPGEIDVLESMYACEWDQVNYTQFADMCESVYTDHSLDKNPQTSVSEVPAYVDPRDVLNDDEERIVHACLQRIGYAVFVRRLHIKPFFQDKDRTNSGWVTTTRFRSILDLQQLTINDTEHTLLCRRFAKRQNEVNYAEFVNVLKNYSGDSSVF